MKRLCSSTNGIQMKIFHHKKSLMILKGTLGKQKITSLHCLLVNFRFISNFRLLNMNIN